MISTVLMLLALQPLNVFQLDLNALQFNSSREPKICYIPSLYPQLDEIKAILDKQRPALAEPVINKVLTSLKCASNYHVSRNNILTIIDYSLPSNQKRLWVFDLQAKTLLFHTYVSHGIKSGSLLTTNFSNIYNSKASSLGVYRTEKAYYGREGLSLRLEGLDKSFNDNAFNRSIVMHGGWYMDEQFIKRYGRPGRSWGCPALPLSLYQAIINTIKDESLFVVYYPDEKWFEKSKFLNCEKMNTAQNRAQAFPGPSAEEPRENVLFAGLIKGGEEPILVMSANKYEQTFHKQAPLARMLRRQINKEEFVAISDAELYQLSAQNNKAGLAALYFVIPQLHMVRGYYETQMKIIDLGTIQDIRPVGGISAPTAKNFTVNFNHKAGVKLRASDKFIRWLGL